MRAWIALGANLGSPVRMLIQVLSRLRKEGRLQLRAWSPIYDTSPVDSSGPNYANAVARVSMEGTAEDLHDYLCRLEQINGRVRPQGVHNAPRTLDLDILLLEGRTRQTPRLQIPHPRMKERLFVLVPLLAMENPRFTWGEEIPLGLMVQDLQIRVGDRQSIHRVLSIARVAEKI